MLVLDVTRASIHQTIIEMLKHGLRGGHRMEYSKIHGT